MALPYGGNSSALIGKLIICKRPLGRAAPVIAIWATKEIVAAENYDHDKGVLDHLISVRARIAAGDPIDPECWDWQNRNSRKKEWDNLGGVGKVIVGALAAPYVVGNAGYFAAALPTLAVYSAFAAVTEPLIDAVNTRLKEKSKK